MKFLRKIKQKHYKAYSLLEMLITLVLTSIVMLGLIQLLVVILRVSASTYNRSLLREDSNNFALEFEKDLKNARRVGQCEGENAGLICEFFTDRFFRWQACNVQEADVCLADQGSCNDRSARGIPNPGGDPGSGDSGERLSMCKYALNPDGSVANNGEPVTVFDRNYNLNLFRIEEIADEPIDDSPDSESFRRVLLFTTVTSHPNSRLNINNIVRQSVVTTKNFEVVIENQASNP